MNNIKTLKNTILNFENEIKERFENKGWKVKTNNSETNFADFSLYKGNKLIGYVDTFMSNNQKNSEKIALNKIERDIKFIKKNKPLIFIITDGITYYVSSFGGLFEEQHFVPGPEDYNVIKALINDYAKALDIGNEGGE